MTLPQEIFGVSYEPLDTDSSDQAALVVAQAFAGYEPMAVAQKISVHEFAAHLRSLGPVLAEEGLTVIARDRQAGEIIGALVTRDFAPTIASEGGEGTGAIDALLNALSQPYIQTRTIRAGAYLLLNLLAVSDRHKGRSVAYNMVRLCLENGMKKGYTNAVTEATGLISQHIFRKCGFVERHEIVYKDFTYEGENSFESIEGHPSAILMDKALVN